MRLMFLVTVVFCVFMSPSWGSEEIFAKTGEALPGPHGWYEFAESNPPANQSIAPEDFVTGRQWSEVERINAEVNAEIGEATDEDHWGENVPEKWSLPTDGWGDCEDFALLKRDRLMKRGIPPSVLLMTVVTMHNGEGHAVLMVRTREGDRILDNLDPDIKLWSETPYRLMKRQSGADPNIWVRVDDIRPLWGITIPKSDYGSANAE